MEFEPWFKLKRYPHIGSPIRAKDYEEVKNYVNDSEAIRKHSFLPLLHKKIVTRKFRADGDNVGRTPKGKRFRRKLDSKVREIFYASHLDSMIFSKYNDMLSFKYEVFLKEKPFNESVVAYRQIKRSGGSKGNKSNIEFAKAAFEFIAQRKTKETSVIIADFSSFFDNLDHKTLKRQWSRVLAKSTLPPDHYNVFKALTRKRYVNGDELFEAYGRTMLVEKAAPNKPRKISYVRKKIKGAKFFKEKGAAAYCEKKDFLKNNINLIVTKKTKKGIPQGSPISATLANVYMIDFDCAMHAQVQDVSGFYQRYSDDLIIVCDRAHEVEIVSQLFKNIELISPVELSPNKTKLYHFQEVDGLFKGYQVDLATHLPNFNKTLEYLGFTFDGNRVLLKTAGISKFYRNMKSSFHRRTSFAIHSKNPSSKIFKGKLYKRFTHRGANRRLIHIKTRKSDGKSKRLTKFDWGNYISYIKKADVEMGSINGNSSYIKRQSRRFWRKFHILMRESEQRIIRHYQSLQQQ